MYPLRLGKNEFLENILAIYNDIILSMVNEGLWVWKRFWHGFQFVDKIRKIDGFALFELSGDILHDMS